MKINEFLNAYSELWSGLLILFLLNIKKNHMLKLALNRLKIDCLLCFAAFCGASKSDHQVPGRVCSNLYRQVKVEFFNVCDSRL